MQTQYILGYWKIRGLGFNIRAVLEYLNVPYKLEEYQQGDGPEFSKDVWFSVKHSLGYDFPNLPYLQCGDLKLTETVPIIQFLANKHDKSLLGKNENDFGYVQMIGAVIHDSKMQITRKCYADNDKQSYIELTEKVLAPIVKFLGQKQYLLGDYITWPDLYFLEMLDLAEQFSDGLFFQTYPTLKTYHENLKSLPRIKAWRESDRFFQGPFNNKHAKTNN